MKTINKSEIETVKNSELKILNKSELAYNFKDSDYELIYDYLEEVFKRSTSAYRSQKSTILNLFDYLKKDVDKITMIDIKEYFDNVIDKRINRRNNEPIGRFSKETYRSYLNSFFDYIIGRFLEKGFEFRNPVPNRRIYKFTHRESDIRRQSEIKFGIFTNQELLDILHMSKKKRLQDFILFSLLIIDGARISEILSIKMENINIEERYYETGFVKDARKTTRHTNESLVFFFPENFKPYLKQYINYIGKNNVWLFSGRTKHLSYGGFRNYVLRNYEKKYSKFHKFRSTLISDRLYKANCPLWISEGLTNHQISNSTQIKHYAKLTLKQKRELYDKYFPYYSFPYF